MENEKTEEERMGEEENRKIGEENLKKMKENIMKLYSTDRNCAYVGCENCPLYNEKALSGLGHRTKCMDVILSAIIMKAYENIK